jgi:MtN3 and saliva related transmembrane protein
MVERDIVTKGSSMTSTILGITAASWAILMATGPILQIRQMRRHRSSAGVSIAYLGVLLVGFVLWIAYGVASHDLPLIVPNCVALAVMSLTIAVALEYRPTPRPD